MLPRIARQANRMLYWLDHNARKDAVDEVVANAYVVFAELARRGKADIVYASVLARCAIAQFLQERKAGCWGNTNRDEPDRSFFPVIDRVRVSFKIHEFALYIDSQKTKVGNIMSW
jgi:hypothetical protein